MVRRVFRRAEGRGGRAAQDGQHAARHRFRADSCVLEEEKGRGAELGEGHGRRVVERPGVLILDRRDEPEAVRQPPRAAQGHGRRIDRRRHGLHHHRAPEGLQQPVGGLQRPRLQLEKNAPQSRRLHQARHGRQEQPRRQVRHPRLPRARQHRRGREPRAGHQEDRDGDGEEGRDEPAAQARREEDEVRLHENASERQLPGRWTREDAGPHSEGQR
mmetsp:Transcript_4564/g.11132  ORF Transcript_4564/g.11132 Transcript_4564/m.11132 type:complete len:216 (+) Transcript_4564:301-948(+)